MNSLFQYLAYTVPAEAVGTVVGLAILAVAWMVHGGEEVPDDVDLGGN